LTPIKRIFSYENQLVAASLFQYMKIIKILQFAYSISDKKILSPIPSTIKTIFEKMSVKLHPTKLFSSKNFGFNAGVARDQTIIIGEELLKTCSPQEVEFVIGHELGHVLNNHHIKKLLVTLVALGVSIALPLGIERLSERLKKDYPEATYPKIHTIISSIQKVSTFITENPLLSYLFYKQINAYFSRYCEKEADLTAAKKIGHAAGGISFFENLLTKKYTNTRSLSRLRYLNPFYWHSMIEHAFFSSHPDHTTRIDYLKKL
jgi:Zn-dependent protease with chaperone function